MLSVGEESHDQLSVFGSLGYYACESWVHDVCNHAEIHGLCLCFVHLVSRRQVCFDVLGRNCKVNHFFAVGSCERMKKSVVGYGYGKFL